MIFSGIEAIGPRRSGPKVPVKTGILELLMSEDFKNQYQTDTDIGFRIKILSIILTILNIKYHCQFPFWEKRKQIGTKERNAEEKKHR